MPYNTDEQICFYMNTKLIQAACPFGTLKTNTFCCNTVASGYTCKDFDCDTDGNCEPKTFKGLIETLAIKS